MSRLLLLSLFGRFSGPFPVPVETMSAFARRRGQGRPLGRRETRLVLDGAEHGRTLVMTEAVGKARHAQGLSTLLCSMLAALAVIAAATSAAQASASSLNATVDAAVDEAAARFGIPPAWIYAVMRQESGGRASAVSPKGAIGLLQLMPSTWRDLTLEFGLGDDPFEPRANILAGTAYMRRMYDRFGAPGFLAAYNAGPERYARSLIQGAALPPETQNYVRKLAPVIAQARSPDASIAPQFGWRTAGIFVARGSTGVMADKPQFSGAAWPPVRQ